MPFLKTPDGYSVGTVECIVPVEKPIIAGNAKIRDYDEAGIRVEEVAFTIFYPADVQSGDKKHRRGLRWLTGPLKTEIAGLKQFLGMSIWIASLLLAPFIYVFGQFIKIPVYPNAPLLRSEADVKWPLVIFSHGLGGSPTAYSQVCVRLAAAGKVVVSLQHRDGTAPSCITPYKGHPRTLLYIHENEVQWAEKPKDALPLRIDQLIVRQHEIYTAYAAVAKFVSASGHSDTPGSIQFINAGEYDKNTWFGAVNLEDICLAGHSFGGCTVFTILSTKPPTHPNYPNAEPYPHLPIRDLLILDPWLDPLPSPGPAPFSTSLVDDGATLVSTELNDNDETNGVTPKNAKSAGFNRPRLLVITSEAFTLWKTHFERLEGIVKGWGPDSKLVTLVKCAHTSFSDYHVFPLTGTKSGLRLMDIISQLSVYFLDSKSEQWSIEEALKDTPAIKVHTKMPGKIVIGKYKDGRNKHKLDGEVGHVIIH